MKLDPNQRPFKIKNALQNISFELRTCRKKNSKLSPFEAHYGRKANTALSNITSKPNIKKSKLVTLKYYLDDNIIGEDELISQDKWYDEDLDSDEEVRTTKQRKLKEASDDVKNKIIGQRAIRKRGLQASNSDRKAKANLTKVNRIRIPLKKTYQPSPKKGSPKKRKLSTASSKASADEQVAEPHDSDSSQDSIATFKQHGNPFVIVTDEASTRRSARDKKKPTRYGDLTELSSSDNSMENSRPRKPRKGVGIASYSPPRPTPAATCTSPVHSVIPTIAPSPIDPNENIGNPSPDLHERQTKEDVLAIYNEDQPECSLQPHEY